MFRRLNLMKWAGLLILLLSAWGCHQQHSSANTQSGLRNLPPDEVKQIIDTSPGVPIIDVRSEPEFTGPLGHIKNARLLPLGDMENWSQELEDYKNQEIILVCRSGNRSGIAARYLKDKGFKNLVNMSGGMVQWNQKGYPIEK